MALIPNPRPDKYGGVLLDGDRAVTGFTRRGSDQPGRFISSGRRWSRPTAFLSLEDGVPAESVLGVYPALMASRPGSVRGFVSDATFQDIGTPADLLADLARPRRRRRARRSPALGPQRPRRPDRARHALGAVGRRHDRRRRGDHRMRRRRRRARPRRRAYLRAARSRAGRASSKSSSSTTSREAGSWRAATTLRLSYDSRDGETTAEWTMRASGSRAIWIAAAWPRAIRASCR